MLHKWIVITTGLLIVTSGVRNVVCDVSCLPLSPSSFARHSWFLVRIPVQIVCQFEVRLLWLNNLFLLSLILAYHAYLSSSVACTFVVSRAVCRRFVDLCSC